MTRGVGNPSWIRDKKEAKLIKKYADQWRKDNGYKDFLEEAEKEKAELNESYKESVRQTQERNERSKR